jgi:hypothetical protein
MAKAQGKSEKQELVCPICRLLADVCECFAAKSDFLTHLNNARLEILEGIRSLLDARIEALRKRGKGEKRTSKIEVS